MNTKQSLSRYGLVPDAADLDAIRELLAAEVAAELAYESGEPDLALLCCVQLFARAQASDVLRIWAAKGASMDLDCSLDVQLLCGAGLDETRKMLAADGCPEAAAALDYLERCIAAGDFDDFSPAAQLAWYRRYFGLEA